MEFKEFTAKTVEDAITEATIQFGVPSDKLEYEIIKEGSTGLFGIFSKDAVIKARVKEANIPQSVDKKETSYEADPVKNTVEKKEKAEDAHIVSTNEENIAKPDNADQDNVKQQRTSHKGGRDNYKKKDFRAREDDHHSKDKRDLNERGGYEKKTSADEQDEASEKMPVKEYKPKSPEEIAAISAQTKKFFEDVLEKMECQAEVNVTVDDLDRRIDVDLVGETGDIIGKRGATLDALQYLAGIVVNKGSDDYFRLKLDTKNYRERRAKTLENLAANVANKVKKTRHKVAIEPMNPYERRIIHAYLQSDSHIMTKSEGEEPNRRVVVYYKR